MKNKKQDTLKNPKIIIDNSLKKYLDRPRPQWIQDKIDKGNEMLKKTGLPPEYYNTKPGKGGKQRKKH